MKTKRWLSASLLCTASSVLIFAIMLWNIKIKNERVSALANDIELQTKQESKLQSVRDLILDTKSSREQLDSYFVSKDNAVSFIEMLESLGRENQLSVKTESAETSELPAVSEYAEKLRVTLQAEGSLQNITRFLGLLELIPYQSTVEQILISHGTDADKDIWNSTIAVSVLKEK